MNEGQLRGNSMNMFVLDRSSVIVKTIEVFPRPIYYLLLYISWVIRRHCDGSECDKAKSVL